MKYYPYNPIRKQIGNCIRQVAHDGSYLPYLDYEKCNSSEAQRAFQRGERLRAVAEIFYPWSEYQEDLL